MADDTPAEVQRETPITTICVCRLRLGDGVHPEHDSCRQSTSGPDEPVCEFCIAAQHPKFPGWDPIVKEVPRAGTRVQIVRLP